MPVVSLLVAQGRIPNSIYERAASAFQQGKLREAEQTLRAALREYPRDGRALGLMGVILDAERHYNEAEGYYRKALQLAPGSASLLNNLGNHYLARSDFERARRAFLKVVALDPNHLNANLHLAHISVQEKRGDAALRYLSHLPREEQNSPAVELLRAQALALAGKKAEATALLRRIEQQAPADPKALADYGRALLEGEQYSLAREFLERAVAAGSASIETRLDLAIAMFHSSGSGAALAEIDKIPAPDRNGDYFLLRAQILDAMGRFDQAVDSLNQGFRAAPTRPDLYFQAALFLIKHERYRETLDLLRQATQVLPDERELLLAQAITLELLREPDPAQAVLKQIESRWPEWGQPYLVNGIMLEIRLRSAEAKPLLETAIALGARDAVAYYYLASAITHAAPEDTESAQKAINEALRLNPDDAYIRSLAGKIAYARKDYPGALEHLNAAIRLWPDMIEARQTLSATYRALGEKEKSVAELQVILRIKQQNRAADQTPPFPVQNLLFTVRPPS